MCEDNFNFLTKMCLLANRELAFAMAAARRGPSVGMLGGRISSDSDASDHRIGDTLRTVFVASRGRSSCIVVRALARQRLVLDDLSGLAARLLRLGVR